MSRKSPFQNNSIFEATKRLSIGEPLGNIEVHQFTESETKKELTTFQIKFPAFRFYWAPFWQGFDSFECYCYGTTGNKHCFDFTRICMIVQENSEHYGVLPLVYTYDYDRSFNASAVNRGYEEPLKHDINLNLKQYTREVCK